MICNISVAVLDDNEINIAKIINVLTILQLHGKTNDNAVEQVPVLRTNIDCEIERIYTFENDNSLQNVPEKMKGIDIALISLDFDKGLRCGELIYSVFPDCRILYYSTQPCKIAGLLHTRPISYHFLNISCNDSMLVLEKKLRRIVDELLSSVSILKLSSKRVIKFIPLRNIAYIESDLKKIIVHTTDGEADSFLIKLSEVEKKLSDSFLRIHQSYIVNKNFVNAVDKSGHLLVLNDGTELAISQKRYAETVDCFEKETSKMTFCL